MYEVYRTLARELSLRLDPADPGMMTFALDLTGELDGQPIKLHRLNGSGARIKVTSPIVPHLDLGLGLTRAGVASKVSEWFGKRDIQLDDEPFDKAFTIRGDEPERVRALLNPELRQAVGNHDAPLIELTDGEFSAGGAVQGASSYGVSDTVEYLTFLLRNVAKVARLVGQAHANVPPARALQAHHALWTEYARDNQFQLGATPLWMQGKLGKTWVLARASRNRENDFSLELSARPDQPPNLTLTIVPKQSWLESMTGGAEHATKDPAFDSVFDVMRPDRPDLVDADLRAGLLGLARLGSVSLHGAHLRLALPATIAPPRVPELLEGLRAILVILERNLHGSDASYR